LTPCRIAIVSDIHHASAAEALRKDHVLAPITNPWRRWAVRQYRHWIWMRDPFAHNHLLDRFCSETATADLAVANGDYSCDSAYIGVSDDAAFVSARECLEQLRQTFGVRLRATFGDHEIGKKMLAANEGGLRLKSYQRARAELALEPFWKVEIGNYVLIGITSTLAAWPVYEAEALAEEREGWRQVREEHLTDIRQTFSGLKSSQRMLLFCHDPSALPFLWREECVRSKLPQLERTIIGHLHSNAVFRQSRRLAGMPKIGFLGHTPRRLSSALAEARHWAAFRPLLCPSTSGIQLLKDGGYYLVELDLKAEVPARFEFHPLKW
jgi:hypothetical protein